MGWGGKGGWEVGRRWAGRGCLELLAVGRRRVAVVKVLAEDVGPFLPGHDADGSAWGWVVKAEDGGAGGPAQVTRMQARRRRIGPSPSVLRTRALVLSPASGRTQRVGSALAERFAPCVLLRTCRRVAQLHVLLFKQEEAKRGEARRGGRRRALKRRPARQRSNGASGDREEKEQADLWPCLFGPVPPAAIVQISSESRAGSIRLRVVPCGGCFSLSRSGPVHLCGSQRNG